MYVTTVRTGSDTSVCGKHMDCDSTRFAALALFNPYKFLNINVHGKCICVAASRLTVMAPRRFKDRQIGPRTPSPQAFDREPRQFSPENLTAES